MVTPQAKREAVKEVKARWNYSERRACELVGVSRSTVRYKPVGASGEHVKLRERIKELAMERKRSGYRMIHALLRREGIVVNLKRVHRIWKEERLQVPRKRRWLKERRVKTMYIEPGSPWENPYIESFNGTFRDECLNMNVFGSVEEARRIVELWRQDYNGSRPHSSLGYLTPLEFSEQSEGKNQPLTSCAGSSSQPPASFHFQHKKASTLSFKLVQK